MAARGARGAASELGAPAVLEEGVREGEAGGDDEEEGAQAGAPGGAAEAERVEDVVARHVHAHLAAFTSPVKRLPEVAWNSFATSMA